MKSITTSLQSRTLSQPCVGPTKFGQMHKNLTKEQEELKQLILKVSNLSDVLESSIEASTRNLEKNDDRLNEICQSKFSAFQQEQEKLAERINEIGSSLSSLQDEQQKTQQGLQKFNESLKTSNKLMAKLGREITGTSKSIVKLGVEISSLKIELIQNNPNLPPSVEDSNIHDQNDNIASGSKSANEKQEDEYVFLSND